MSGLFRASRRAASGDESKGAVIRRLDHVAITVQSTSAALQYFRDHLGLGVVHSEELAQPSVKLTYLDAGNAFLQLIEPLDDGSEIARSLAQNGEGIHHICFGVDDALATARALSSDGVGTIEPGTGRGRASAFLSGSAAFGVRIECTEFDRRVDVDETPGWLADEDGRSAFPTARRTLSRSLIPDFLSRRSHQQDGR